MEEGRADPPFEPSNRLRNRGFGEAKLGRRARERAGLMLIPEEAGH
jgi:hypothetical protein